MIREEQNDETAEEERGIRDHSSNQQNWKQQMHQDNEEKDEEENDEKRHTPDTPEHQTGKLIDKNREMTGNSVKRKRRNPRSCDEQPKAKPARKKKTEIIQQKEQ